MPIQALIAAIDFSSPSDRAARLAGAIAAVRGARLHLVHVEPPPLLGTVTVEPMFVPPQWLEPLRRKHDHEVAGKLTWRAERLREAFPATTVEEHVRLDDPADGLCAAAAEHGAGLIVMATGGAGAARFLLGSVAAKVAQRAPCPVLIADRRKAEQPITRFRRTLCAIDYSPTSRPLADLAAGFTEPDGTLELAHVWHEPRLGWLHAHPERDHLLAEAGEHGRRRLAHFVGDSALDHPRVELWLGNGNPAAALLDRAEATAADLIVLGAHGRHADARALGTVADRVLRHAAAAVLILPTTAVP